MKEGKIKISPSREVAYIAVMCALLIGGQYVFSFIVGVEIVTLLLVCFSTVFGARRGIILSLSFSLLRSILYPFSLTALILYLIYYPALSAIFGLLGHIKKDTYKNFPPIYALIINIVLVAICAISIILFALGVIKVSKYYKAMINTLLIVIAVISAVLCITFDVLFAINKLHKKDLSDILCTLSLATIAGVCTIFFTLLDDVITPLVYGYSSLTWLAYFYSSFTAMLPQTVCTFVTVSTLYLPITTPLKRFCYAS
jgi:hypothetical protein